ncbi:Cullin binding-domain-containing protein [Scheffersomyces xylosifermentans]|uniref:Cullin binding-domain-containing protein n=1 Tax=Scheffersomyces xylosifermentans TaxID=1304137 RepID=UPI00315CB089
MFKNKSSLKQKFAEITGSTQTVAQKYLDSNSYDLQRAVDSYFSDPNNNSLLGSKKSKASSNFNKTLVSVFEQYKDPENEAQIDINGTMQYLEDLGLEPEDPSTLTLSFFLSSPGMGIFNRDSFLHQWQRYKVYDIPAMKNFLKEYHESLVNNQGLYFTEGKDEPIYFKSLYDFTFDFLMEPEQKLLDFESAILYWELLLPLVIDESVKSGKLEKSKKAAAEERTKQWFEFVRSSYKRSFSKDSWTMFYLFFKDVIVTDPINFKDYDEMAAWPSVMDEYIEYLRENELLAEGDQ